MRDPSRDLARAAVVVVCAAAVGVTGLTVLLLVAVPR